MDGRIRNELTVEAMTRAMTVAAGLGNTSAYTWLKVPIVEEMERAMAATTLPAVILGGEVSDPDKAFASWSKALALPTLRHRVRLRPEAEMEGVTADSVLTGLLSHVPVPR